LLQPGSERLFRTPEPLSRVVVAFVGLVRTLRVPDLALQGDQQYSPKTRQWFPLSPCEIELEYRGAQVDSFLFDGKRHRILRERKSKKGRLFELLRVLCEKRLLNRTAVITYEEIGDELPDLTLDELCEALTALRRSHVGLALSLHADHCDFDIPVKKKPE
jgi:hypothetical protein